MYLLIAPYTHQSSLVKKARARATLDVANSLGAEVMAPSLYAHLIGETGETFNLHALTFSLLRNVNGVIAYKLPGYQIDEEFKKTIEAAVTLDIPVQMMDPYPSHLQGNYANVWQSL